MASTSSQPSTIQAATTSASPAAGPAAAVAARACSTRVARTTAPARRDAAVAGGVPSPQARVGTVRAQRVSAINEASAALAPLFAQWADSTLFWTVIPYVMQPAGVAAIFGNAPPAAMKAFAADRAPWELESLDPRVRSRLQGGVAIEMEAPDYDMRLDMLKSRLDAARKDDGSLEIPADLLEHVARNITSSGRDLEGAFNQLVFRRSFEPNLSIERVDELLAHLVGAGEQKRVRIEDIQRIVARHYNVSRQELVSNRRTRVIVKPRQIAMYLSKTLTPRSFPEIGRRFGGRDHTTVLHAVRKIEDLVSEDTKLSHEIELLKRLINENNA